MRQTLQTKTFLTMAALIVGALLISLFKATWTVRKDKEAFLKEESAQTSLVVTGLVQSKIENILATLREFTGAGTEKKAVSELFSAHRDLAVVAVFAEGEKSKPLVLEKSSLAEYQRWARDFESWINRYNLPILKEGEVAVDRVSLVEGYVFFAVATKKAGRIQVALVSSSAFADVGLPFKGSATSAFLVNQKGMAVAHSAAGLVGTDLSEHPVVSEITKTIHRDMSGDYEDLESRKILAHYRRVPGTNLTTVITRLEKPSFAVLSDLRGGYLQILVGFIFFSLAAAFYFSSRIRRGLGGLRRYSDNDNPILDTQDIQEPELMAVAEDLAKARAGLADKEQELEAQFQQKLKEGRQEALVRVSRGLTEELRNPLAGVLGHAQILREKAVDREDLKKHIDAIEKETRRSREIIEELARHAGFPNDRFEATDFYDLMVLAIERVEHRLTLMGIRVQRQLESTPTIKADASHLLHAIVQILNFSAAQMEGAPVKTLGINLQQEGRLARLQIDHTGDPLTADQIEDIFTPFRFARTSSQDLGLGLAAAEGVIRSHGGRVSYVQSSERGGRFEIEIPVTDARLSRAEAPVIHTTIPEIDFEEVMPKTGPARTPIFPSSASKPLSFDIPLPPSFVKSDSIEVRIRPSKVEHPEA